MAGLERDGSGLDCPFLSMRRALALVNPVVRSAGKHLPRAVYVDPFQPRRTINTDSSHPKVRDLLQEWNLRKEAVTNLESELFQRVCASPKHAPNDVFAVHDLQMSDIDVFG